MFELPLGMKVLKYKPLVIAVLLLAAAFIWLFVSSDAPEATKTARASTSNPRHSVPKQAITERKSSGALTESKRAAQPVLGEFSPEMKSIVQGIHAGRTIQLRVGDFKAEYVFRTIDITEDRFQVSSDHETKYPTEYEVFEGRQITQNGSLDSEAKLAVVNDTFSIAFTNEQGDFLIEKNDAGEMVAIQLTDNDPNSSLGDWMCGHEDGMNGIIDTSNGAEAPVTTDIEVVLGAEIDDMAPQISQALTSEPFYRLGKQYDASLKDLSVLMISGSSQTGASSSLSSRAASYFTYSAFVADVYERQLGFRFQLQELILIANDSPLLDPNSGVERPDVELTAADEAAGGNDVTVLREWCDLHRNQETYQWGHATAWTNVDGAPRGVVGLAFTARYGSTTSAYSVNEREFTWGVLVHELGHNVGANHSTGGAMNSTLSFPTQENFFTESENGGFTAARQIYDYMSAPDRAFVTGPADLRHPDEMPFGIDDFVSTATNTPVAFRPLKNDLDATPLFGITNKLRLVETGQIFPQAAGALSISGNEITFIPANGYTGRVWFTYTLGGSIGNNGLGWLHSADVVVTVGGDNSDPDQTPPITITNDIVRTDFTSNVRLNPLLNDEATGRLWLGGVDAITDFTSPGAAESFSEGAFSLVSATVLTGNGSISLETASVIRGGVATTDNTGYLVYTPGANEPSIVEISYTVEDANGNQATGLISLIGSETASISTNLAVLGERDGRVATVTISRSGPTSSAEQVEFLITGSVDLTGANSDVAISGFDSFDASSGTGVVTIPAGQSSVELTVSAMRDLIIETGEVCNISITRLETLAANPSSDFVTIVVNEIGEIGQSIFSENFEAFPLNTSLANGWRHAVSSAEPGVWTTGQNGTPSNDTGPSVDHTLGTNNGRFLYREASNQGRIANTNQQANLLSPVIDLTGVDRPILEFYYHMFGSGLGELGVDVFSGDQWHDDVMEPLIGAQQLSSGDAWLRADIDISSFNTADFQIRFRGITGDNFRSDMAIDDVAIGEALSPAVESPVIQGQPRSIEASLGDSAYFSVVARAFPSPTYQWSRNGQIIPGATRSALFIEDVTSSDLGEYTCVVISGTSETSIPAFLSLGVEDLDEDGLDDAWELAFFGNLNEDGTGDFDNDGVVNLLERAFGTAPNDNNDQSLPTAALVENGNDDFLSLSYRRLEGGTGTTGVDYTAGGIRYTVEYDADLVSPWSSGDVVQLGSAVSNGDGTETVTVRIPALLADGEDTLFMRVMISAAP